jgi:hypothetical protein
VIAKGMKFTLALEIYCSFVHKWRVVLLTHCDQNCAKVKFPSPFFST